MGGIRELRVQMGEGNNPGILPGQRQQRGPPVLPQSQGVEPLGNPGTFAGTLGRFFSSLLSSPWVSCLLIREGTVREWKTACSVKLPLRAEGRGACSQPVAPSSH